MTTNLDLGPMVERITEQIDFDRKHAELVQRLERQRIEAQHAEARRRAEEEKAERDYWGFENYDRMIREQRRQKRTS